jgi:hypothetical protein
MEEPIHRPETAVTHFAALVIGMGNFLNGCASLPQFKKGLTLLEWAMLSARSTSAAR